MKKHVTLLAGLLIVAGAANAQQTGLPTRAKKVSAPSLYTGTMYSAKPEGTEKAGGDVLWSNNFSSATNWVSTAVGATPSAGFGWQIASAPNALLPWAFSTSVNSASDGGYALCENGDPTASPGTQIANTEWILTYDSTFNFSAYSDLIFQFQESGAQFIEKQAVEVSVDGGTNWIEIGTNADLGQLTATGGSAYTNPTTRNYNVTNALGGGAIPATLKFRFRVTWPANAGVNSGIMYGWFVDDVKFIEGFPNDMRIDNAYSFTGSQLLSYTKFPASQANDGLAETTIAVKASNTGSASQDALLTVTNTGYNATSNQTTIPGFSADSLVVTSTYTIPATTGVANFTAAVSSNNNTLSNTTDDTKLMKFEVTNNIMGVDAYTGIGSSMTGAFTSFVGQATGELTGIGTIFEIFEDGEIGAFEVGIANITGATNQAPYVGKEFYVSWYRLVGQDFVYEDETAPRTLATTNFGKIVKFYLPTTISVTAGDVILAVATSFVDSEVPFGFSGFITAGNTVGLAGTADDIIGLASDDATPTIVEAPVLRLDFQSYVGLEEMELGGVSAYPNPFNNSTEISFDLKADAAVSVVVTDLAGRQVLNIPAANYAAGSHSVTIDGGAMSAGVYNCTITAGNATTTKRIVKK